MALLIRGRGKGDAGVSRKKGGGFFCLEKGQKKKYEIGDARMEGSSLCRILQGWWLCSYQLVHLRWNVLSAPLF